MFIEVDCVNITSAPVIVPLTAPFNKLIVSVPTKVKVVPEALYLMGIILAFDVKVEVLCILKYPVVKDKVIPEPIVIKTVPAVLKMTCALPMLKVPVYPVKSALIKLTVLPDRVRLPDVAFATIPSPAIGATPPTQVAPVLKIPPAADTVFIAIII